MTLQKEILKLMKVFLWKYEKLTTNEQNIGFPELI